MWDRFNVRSVQCKLGPSFAIRVVFNDKRQTEALIHIPCKNFLLHQSYLVPLNHYLQFIKTWNRILRRALQNTPVCRVMHAINALAERWVARKRHQNVTGARKMGACAHILYKEARVGLGKLQSIVLISLHRPTRTLASVGDFPLGATSI